MQWFATVLLSIVLCGSSCLLAQDRQDPCRADFRWTVPNGFSLSNPDSVLIDTCQESPTFQRRYAKKYFDAFFSFNAIHLPWYPPDSVVEVPWESIDTLYHATREGFQTLEKRFGHFLLQKSLPASGDTSSPATNMFYIRFDDYVDIDSVVGSLTRIEGLRKTDYWMRYGYDFGAVRGQGEETNPDGVTVVIVGSRLAVTCRETSRENSVEISDVRGAIIARAELNSMDQSKHAVVSLDGVASGHYLLRCGRFAYPFVLLR